MPWLDRIAAEEPRIRPGSPGAFAIALGWVTLALMLRWALGAILDGGAPFVTFFPAVMLASFIGGLGPGLLATALGAFLGWYFFMPSAWSLAPAAAQHGLLPLEFAVVSSLYCVLVHAFQLAVARLREARAKQQHILATLEGRVAERTQELARANAELRAEIAQREEAEAMTRQAQKLDAIGQLAGGIAHDFNNLLTVIFGNLDALERRIASDPDACRLLEGAAHGAERGALLTQRLLAFARRQPLAPARVDVNALIGGVMDMLRRTVGAHVTFETSLADGLCPAQCDPHQLETALLNLVINARDAIGGPGRVTIATANARLDDADPRSADGMAPGDYVMLAISDSGAGMSPETAARAGEPFFTTKPAGQGSGLGLSMVYGFVKQSGGTIRIESEPGRGTTVKLFLPGAPPIAQPPLSRTPAEQAVAR